jgi:Predicted transcriptional regulators
MKTVKQVAELSGVSVRTLQYYDEIGVFKPTKISDSGYRLYDEEALKVLQQILFFKELDFQLGDIKKIMEDPKYDKINAFKKQKELIKVKYDRLNGLLCLLEKLEKGETCMSFKEFDMSDYILALEKFKDENKEAVIKNWGSIEAFEKFVTMIKDKETEVAKMAIMQYGSIEKYTEAMKDNLAHFPERIEEIERVKEINEANVERSKILTKELVSDLTVDVKSSKIQSIIHELVQISEEITQGINMGENFWDMVIDGYFHNADIIKANDKLYGEGTSDFMGRSYKYYFNKRNSG